MTRFNGEGALDYGQRITRLVPGYELLHQLSASQLMGLHAYRAGLPRIASEQMVLRLAQDFFPLDERQTRHLLQAAGFGVGRRFFQALGFHGWLAERL
ncbi:hypothetical protein [Aeromonas hydrophila]|uniref:hypothetical protein n=1 Tax=Aeromonas hydrophila TaxID=644 RepID=UPI002B48A19C|nr:hypothetical protein [Aeromonas hydrophila]